VLILSIAVFAAVLTLNYFIFKRMGLFANTVLLASVLLFVYLSGEYN
jgi:hypothetical protein